MTILESAGYFLAAKGEVPLRGREPARLYSPESDDLAPTRPVGSILNHLHTQEAWTLVAESDVPPRLRELLQAAGPDPFAA